MILFYFLLLILHLFSSSCDEYFINDANNYVGHDNLSKLDVDLIEFPLNLEYMEAEYFLWGSFGHGLDQFAPELADGGPKPIGVRIANLSPLIRDVIAQFGYQEVGHVR